MILMALILLQGTATLDCDNAMMQVDMNQCAGREYEAADRQLNIQWTQTAAHMRERDQHAFDDGRPGYFETLLAAQRAWLSYRDTHCRSEGYYARGGSLEPLLISTCKTTLTEERTAQLASLIEDN